MFRKLIDRGSKSYSTFPRINPHEAVCHPPRVN
jgi:hypothetical protein